ncbi:Chitinase-3-like protein 1 [Halotydeus destructor]|nr:Chitinase-3-like protein 1 [Halotydeus destructor]
MGKIEVFILLFVFILCNISVSQGQFRLNCYLSNPEKNGVPWWRMNMAVAADHCTHLTYGHANIDGEKMVPANATGDRVAYDKLREIRDKSIYGTKLLISVPTPDADFLGNKALSRIVKSRDSRVTFLRNVMEFLEMHKFDGIVLFWKYPGVTSMGGAATDRAGLAELVVELKIAFHGRGYILGLIGGANMDVVTQSTFDFASITKYVDFIDIGTHLRQLKSSPVPVHMAPLNVYAPALVTSPANRRSMTDSVMHWLTSGAQSSALNIAITTVGLHQKLTQEYDISQLDQLQPNRLMVVPDYTRQRSFS